VNILKYNLLQTKCLKRKSVEVRKTIKESASTFNNCTVYPNPATTTLYIDLKEDADLFERVELYDLAGSYHTVEIPVNRLAAGMYIVKIIKRNNEYDVARFVKIND